MLFEIAAIPRTNSSKVDAATSRLQSLGKWCSSNPHSRALRRHTRSHGRIDGSMASTSAPLFAPPRTSSAPTKVYFKSMPFDDAPWTSVGAEKKLTRFKDAHISLCQGASPSEFPHLCGRNCKDTVILKSDLESSFDNKMILPKCATSM